MSPKEATAKRLALKSIDDRLITSRARQRAYEAKGDAGPPRSSRTCRTGSCATD
jgi:hypothetical protein